MIIGVTGSLGTGTSTAARYIAKALKAELINADKVAHKLLNGKASVSNRLVLAFGKEIIDKKGVIDRAKLAERAFRKKATLKKLSNIMYPVIITGIDRRIKAIYKKKPSAFIVVDGAVIIESNFYKECDRVVLVASSLSVQLERARKNKKLLHSEALSRIRLQMPLCRKARYADYIIDNGGSLKELKQQCTEITKDLKGVRKPKTAKNAFLGRIF